MPAPVIGVDVRIADRPGLERTGVGRYAVEAARALVSARSAWEVRLFSNRPELFGDVQATVVPTRWPTARSVGRVGWLHVGAAAVGHGLDAWVGLAFTLPWWWRGPSLVTIHDLIFLEHRELYAGRVNALYATAATRRAARSADVVVCGAGATRDLLAARFAVEPSKVHVLPYGVDHRLRTIVPERDAAAPYALVVGTWEPRKGLDLLPGILDAVNRDRAPQLRLVLVGRPGWGVERELEALRDHPLIELRTGVDDDALHALYGRAAALLYPSRAEGFGLPVAEAMAAGCPVVAGDLPSVREFAGEAPRYASPGDARAFADALAAVLEPAEADRRQRAGRRAAAELDWDVHGRRIAEELERVLR